VVTGGVGIGGALYSGNHAIAGTLSATGTVTLSSATASTTSATGALIVSTGGVGLAGALNVGGAVGLGSSLLAAGLATFNGQAQFNSAVGFATTAAATFNAVTQFNNNVNLGTTVRFISPNVYIMYTPDVRSGCSPAFVSCTETLISQSFTFNVQSYVHATYMMYRSVPTTGRSDLSFQLDNVEVSVCITSIGPQSYSGTWSGTVAAGTHTLALNNRGCCCTSGVQWGCGAVHGQISTVVMG